MVKEILTGTINGIAILLALYNHIRIVSGRRVERLVERRSES